MPEEVRPEKIFVEGMNVKLPSAKAPEYILLQMGFNAHKFFMWCKDHQDEKGWVNITIKKSQKGSIYGELDTWKPNREQGVQKETNLDDLAAVGEAKNKLGFTPDVNEPIDEIPF